MTDSHPPQQAGVQDPRSLRMAIDADGLGVERAANLSWDLRDELRLAAVGRAEHAAAARTPGAKGVGMELAQLVLAVPGSVSALITVVRGWSRRNGNCSVTIEHDSDKLTVTGLSDEEQERLVERWLERHDFD